MIRHLVVAGSHQQYLNWLVTIGGSPADYQPIDVIAVRGLAAQDVLSLDQVGTYWDNPVWGSEPYRLLMDTGVSLDMHWAMPWEADFLKAKVLREQRPAVPISADEVQVAMAAQADVERMLQEP